MSNEIFEDFPNNEQFTCNDCTHYWDNTCDGLSDTSEHFCNSFSVTRGINIPVKINELETQIKQLKQSVFLCAITLLISSVINLIAHW